HSTAPSSAPSDSAAVALESLDGVATAGPPASGYLRADFGLGWGDPDRNGCDTRNDILGRDLDDVRFKTGTHDCVVTSGTLSDPYTGVTIPFVRGNVTSEAVQIDHIVPLSWAWKYGASTWNEQTRVLFANDPDNLLAVDGPTNMEKSDSGPSDWMPPNIAFRCEYAIDFVGVLASYGLSIPVDDRAELESTLREC
ncbi:HNH endonuclease, partial [Schumannella luteola]